MDYLTIMQDGCGEYTEKKSRFIGYATPVATEAAAIEFVNAIRKKHPDARHNVYAYSVRQNNAVRYSDDGEPQGTAGLPVLDSIKKRQLCDCAVVVTRYFGGILLGTGGLVRAYTAAAGAAVEHAGIVRMSRCAVCRVQCDYGLYGTLAALLEASGAVTTDSDFSDSVQLDFYIELTRFDALQAAVTEKSSGGVLIQTLGQEYRCVSGDAL